MLAEMEAETTAPIADDERDRVPIEPCPQCGHPMAAIRGSKDAICPNCGFKDSCCY